MEQTQTLNKAKQKNRPHCMSRVEGKLDQIHEGNLTKTEQYNLYQWISSNVYAQLNKIK